MTYTYQNGAKVPLRKSDSDFVMRSSAEQIRNLGLKPSRRVSSASFRVSVPPQELESAMSRAREQVTTHHAYSREDSGSDFLISDRVMVRFRANVSEARQMELAGEYALFLRERLSPVDVVFQLTKDTGCNPVKLVVLLTENEAEVIEFVEHDLNREIELSSLALPLDPLYQRSWHLHQNVFDPEVDPRSSTRAEQAWQLLDGFGSSDIVIGVTDDGCRFDHPDFPAGKFAGWGYLEGSNLITDKSIGADITRLYQADANHGTSCCGVAAGAANGQQTVGVAPGVRLFPIKWESSNRRLLISDSKLIRILNYLSDKVDILSNSWGGTPTSIWSLPVVETIATLAKTGGRRGKGILFLFAAGNWNCPLNHVGNTPIPYTSGWTVDAVGTPQWVGVKTSTVFSNNLVGIPGVLHIGAHSSIATRSHYSCWGEGIALSASSNNTHHYQRLGVAGLGVSAATGNSSLNRPDFGGTSCATPIVAGVAALVLSANASLSGLEVGSILKKTASKDLNFSPYQRTPAAAFDPNPAWDVSPVPPFASGSFEDRGLAEGTWSPWFGHGAVNARDAVAAALALQARGPAATSTTYTSNAALLIPDNNSAGIEDRIVVNSPGTILALEVSVDITHTWIGDLRISLVAPNGTEVILHNRSGSSNKNLRSTFRLESTPGLAQFQKLVAAGTWRLRVADLARFDDGRLQSWSIKFTLAAPRVFSDATTVLIPDGDPLGITREVILPGGVAAPMSVRVSISHQDLSQVSLTLLSPSGQPISLASLGSLSGDSLDQLFSPPGLVSQAGSWFLTVRDEVSAAAGKLIAWSIELG
jgi:subtilisin-like proprotein convertase family protein